MSVSVSVTKAGPAELAPTARAAAPADMPEVQGGQPEKPYAMQEVGSSGLAISGGIVGEEYLKDLRGQKGRDIYRRMAESDGIIGAFLFALNQMLSRLDWEWVAPEDASVEENEATAFVQSCWDDMSQSFDAYLEDIVSFATYGWSFFEVVYKKRNGPDQVDGAFRSKHTDGKYGWRKFAVRGQNTLTNWILDDNGDVVGLAQTDATSGVQADIPLAKALLFRIGQQKNNPEGRSLLRNAYRPWFFKSKLEDIEAIGIERELAGYPVVTTPATWHLPDAPAPDKQALQAAVTLARSIRRGESEGVVLPALFDEHGNKLFGIELISSGGSRQIDINGVVTRKNQEIAMSVLADFLTLGHEETGSRSLGVVKIDLWTLSVQAIAKSIAEVFNAHAVQKLLAVNRMRVSRLPQLSFGEVNRVDLDAVGGFIGVLHQAGLITPDEDLEDWARKLINMPPAKRAALLDPELTDDDRRALMEAETGVRPAAPVVPAP